MKQVYAWPPSSYTLEAMIRAWGAKARGRRCHPGPIVFRPLRVKGVFLCLDWENGICVAWICAIGSVSKVEMMTSTILIYKVLFPSISTFETLPTKAAEEKNAENLLIIHRRA